MVPATQQQQQKHSTTATVTAAEEEALKRSTDCVYFLASPLTCKKGSECEYRHSEYARINPRDCYFWLNGSCLNPKCGFRHPPLDGLLGTQGGASTGSSAHSSHAAAPSPSASHVPYNMGKQAVPCVFFQNGGCLKGDRCSFLHITNPTTNKKQRPTEAASVLNLQSVKKPFGGLERCTEGKIVSSANDSKAGLHPDVRVAPKFENAPWIGRGFEKNVPPHVSSERVPQKNMTNSLLVAEGGIADHSNQFLWVHASDDNSCFQNGKDADDFLRESSPGFDVLVDDELRDSDYYLGEDQFGRREQDGRNSVNEYDADFNSNADQEVFHDPRGHESYEHMQERQYGWGQHRASSERILQRGPYPKDESPDHIKETDLRYRLSKQRRVSNGLRSVITHDHLHNYSDERNYNSSHRDAPQEISFSSRLQGRIKLPGRVGGSDSNLESGIERGKNRIRLSPHDRQHISYPGRLRDRITRRMEDNYGEDRKFRASRMRREIYDERNREFLAPKGLAELKGGKDESRSEPLVRKRKSLVEGHHQQSINDVSFDGPLPLSEILKRKRAAGSGSGLSSSVHKEGTPQETKQHDDSYVSKAETVEEEKTEIGHEQSSEQIRAVDAENEQGMGVEGVEGNEYEGNGEYYEEGYEEVGEYYQEGEEEYVEEEDGNDFKNKIDVMFS